jgi:hypothetical protein
VTVSDIAEREALEGRTEERDIQLELNGGRTKYKGGDWSRVDKGMKSSESLSTQNALYANSDMAVHAAPNVFN